MIAETKYVLVDVAELRELDERVLESTGQRDGTAEQRGILTQVMLWK